MAQQKTTCPVSRETFLANAKPISATIAGSALSGAPRVFSTGSAGYMMSGKGVVDVDGTPCAAQISVNVTLIGSKPNGTK